MMKVSNVILQSKAKRKTLKTLCFRKDDKITKEYRSVWTEDHHDDDDDDDNVDVDDDDNDDEMVLWMCEEHHGSSLSSSGLTSNADVVCP